MSKRHGRKIPLAGGVIESLFSTWRDASAAWAIDIVARASHGDLPRWLAALARLPDIRADEVSHGRVVGACATEVASELRERLEMGLRELIPWRKGPFHLFGIDVDSEWRSDLKWSRIAPHVDLDGCRVLDVGSGNGYYGWRMLEAGAKSVVGIDPSLLVTFQHAAVGYYVDRGGHRNTVLPVGLEAFPATAPFDVAFSMGVVYHRRDPAAHIRALAGHAHDETTLVVESLVVDDAPLQPRPRYARMRNVSLVPDLATLRSWLGAAGFEDTEVVDVSPTTRAEQRTTAWMPYQSLAAALDPEDPNRTVEGYPAPKRAAIIARRK
ncbi:MAG: tRNA 5-methoxyuridine(34)/uridine 5-oxyacetic acid(34) synthase CmoB [Gammaproteobacteria bacterium]|nr:tRNA 5-methoxyuridine(34)/uridine 5-oxyacetic acid(34) synthase CmoB [Gammaproteobacteria bacterium]